jgi:hypothetical protein
MLAMISERQDGKTRTSKRIHKQRLVRSYVGNGMVASLNIRSMVRNWAIVSKWIREDEVEDVGCRKGWRWGTDVGQFKVRHDCRQQKKKQ